MGPVADETELARLHWAAIEVRVGETWLDVIDLDLDVHATLRLPCAVTSAGRHERYRRLGSVPTVGATGEVTLELAAADTPTVRLTLFLQAAADLSVLQFQARLSGPPGTRLERLAGAGAWLLSLPQGSDDREMQEVRIGGFHPFWHTYFPEQRRWAPGRVPRRGVPGPLLIIRDRRGCVLLAHEGPVEAEEGLWRFTADDEGSVFLEGHPGSHLPGQDLGVEPWLSTRVHITPAVDLDDAARRYRRFLTDASPAEPALLRPRVHYNTWHQQEEDHYLRGLPYLGGFHEDRLRADMRRARSLGVEVFVLDVGWFARTGDWEPSPDRLPGGLTPLLREAEALGMQLGLWVNPMLAALSSRTLAKHRQYTVRRQGRELPAAPVWETEDSLPMCLASPYLDEVTTTLLGLVGQGVRNLKLDGLWPSDYDWAGVRHAYACDAPDHGHGDAGHTEQARRDRYSYLFSTGLARLVERLARAGATVDVDITETGRWPTLGVLTHGRYFLINNGPYFHELGIPPTTRIEPDTYNAVFFPGAAHARIQRQAIAFDRWIPSTRFLSHVLLSTNSDVVDNALTSLSCGGYGVWGDLAQLPPAHLEALGARIRQLTAVAQPAHAAAAVSTGIVGSSPEIHEMIDPGSMSGAIAVFTHQRANITYRTHAANSDVREVHVTGAAAWSRTSDGALCLELPLEAGQACLVLVEGRAAVPAPIESLPAGSDGRA